MGIETDKVKIPAADGGAFEAYIAKPEGKGPFPSIIVIQEIFGINEDMREKCHELAEDGYFAVCPDLFWRLEPGIELYDSNEEQLQKAFDLYEKFDEEMGLTDLQTTLGYVRNHKFSNEKTGCVGYCLGGKLAFMMACYTDVDSSVAYYGVAIETMLDRTEKIQKPLLVHIAEEDEFVNKEAQVKIKSALSTNGNVTIKSYPAVQHAFARNEGMHYDHAAATLANTATDDFFAKHLK